MLERVTSSFRSAILIFFPTLSAIRHLDDNSSQPTAQGTEDFPLFVIAPVSIWLDVWLRFKVRNNLGLVFVIVSLIRNLICMDLNLICHLKLMKIRLNFTDKRYKILFNFNSFLLRLSYLNIACLKTLQIKKKDYSDVKKINRYNKTTSSKSWIGELSSCANKYWTRRFGTMSTWPNGCEN